MPAELYAGTLESFDNSMAKSIEDALAALLPVPLPAATNEVIKDRRRLFIAIAEGVIRHLKDQQAAFEVTVDIDFHDPVTVTPNIKVWYLP